MTVYHLKYRPTKVADLDLHKVRDFLKKVLSSNDIPQSFLFSGPKGSGKTSAARIVAKSINCTDRLDGEACGKCDSCLLIDKGGVTDIIEMDAASNRGIDEVRALKDKIYMSPVSLKNKVFVIDEVHMMTKEAFNAMLKILEEPPKNVYFILCTTNAEKIPETVLSRLLRVDFSRSSIDEMVNSLKRVVEGEKISLKDEQVILEKIAVLSEGSFRNGQKLLMELIMDKGNKVDMDSWLDFFNAKFSQAGYQMEDFEADILAGSVKEMMQKLEKVGQGGTDMADYRQRLIEYFQTRLVSGMVDGSDGGLNTDKCAYLLRLLITAGRDEKEAFLPQLPLQLVVVDFFEKYGGSSGGKKEKEKTEKTNEELVKVTEAIKATKPVNYKLDDVKSRWKELLVAVRPYNHSVEAFLRAARPVEVEGGRLVIEVFYKFHKERLEDARNRRIVEMGFEQVWGGKVMFECRLAAKGTPVDLVAEESAGNGDKLYDVAKEIFG